MKLNHVEGKNKGNVVLYALSTCIWCKQLKELLDKIGVAYDYVYVDTLEGEERENARKAVMEKNPDCSYPTLIINDKECVVGFQKDKIKELLK